MQKVWPCIGFSAVALVVGGLSALFLQGPCKTMKIGFDRHSHPGLGFPRGVDNSLYSHGYFRRYCLVRFIRSGKTICLGTVGGSSFSISAGPFYFSIFSGGCSRFWLLVLLLLVIAMISRFSRISTTAAQLNYPYILWLCFAGYLNFASYILNG